MSPRRFILATSLALLAAHSHAQTIPAFPGAEGYGAYAVGGRNGDVYHVTNLNASGAGSFADAIATVPSTGRTIVFDVSGYIRFPSGSNGTRLTSSKVTIAGQTAPGDGIGFYNNFFRISGDDIVIRHVRFRMGKYGSGGDCVDLDSGSLNAILDHVSMEFSTDENMSSFGSAPENLTLQYSLNAWGLETHSCGGLWDQNHATSHHNLWAHNHTRNPKSRPNGLLEWINNVTFDWDIGFIMGDTTSVQTYKSNVINNYFIGPPGNTQSKALVKGTVATNGYPNFTIFLSGNLTDTNGDSILNGTDKGYSIVEGTPLTSGTATAGTYRYYQATSAIGGSTAGVATDDALAAYKKIVSNAGALRLDNDPAQTLRDEVDTRLMAYLVALRTKHITRESDLAAADPAVGGLAVSNSGFGTLSTALAPTDTDRDGMPDFWEAAVGWNSAVDDHKHVLTASELSASFFPAGTASGYTSLEEYLHFRAVPHGTVAKWVSAPSTSITINLAKFTSAFTSSPSFAVTGLTSGTFAQFLADGTTPSTTGPIIKFTPAQNTVGRVKFNFTVTDSAGSTWTQQFALLVTVAGAPRNLVWVGDGSANAWNTTTNNWLLGATPTLFSAGDSALIDDQGSATPAMSLAGTLSPSAVTIDATKNYTLAGSGTLAGAMSLVKSGGGTLTISNSGANTFSGGTTLNEGTITLTSTTANSSGLGTGKITILNGTVNMFDNGTNVNNSTTLPNDLEIVGTATINTAQRGSLGGDGTGAGTLNLVVPWIRLDLSGNWSAFAGTLNANADADGGDFRINNNATTWANTHLNLGDKVSMYYVSTGVAGGLTIPIGEFDGPATSNLRGGPTSGRPTTFEIGGLNGDSTFLGTIAEQTGSAVNITKNGTGTLTLGGTSTYTGATLVNAGTLLIMNGALGATATTIAGGATLAGAGGIGGVVTLQNNAILSPGTPNAVGNLGVGAGFVATSSTFNFGLSINPDPTPGTPNSANDRVTLTGGTIDLNNGAANTLAVTYLGGALGIGTYTLFTGGAATQGTTANLTFVAPAGTRQSFALSFPAGKVQLIVGGSPSATLTWVGGINGATWDFNASANFTNAGSADIFKNLDAVVLNDTTANRTVTLAGSLAPRTLTVDTTAGYSIIGAGTLDGAGSLTKTLTGTLTITNTAASTFSGGTTISGGTIGLGTGAVVLNGGTLTMFSADLLTNTGTLPNTITVNTTGRLNVGNRCGFSGRVTGSGVLTYYTPYVRADITGDWSAFSGQVNVINDGGGGDFRITQGYSWPGLGLASVNLADRSSFYFAGTLASGAGTFIDIGELSGGPLAYLMGGATGGRNFTYTIGGKTPLGSEVIYAGTIAEQNTATATNYVKMGAGTWTLSGTCAWNGGTTIAAGTLRISGSVTSGGANFDVLDGTTLDLVNGSLTAADVQISANAKLTGKGAIHGDLTNAGLIECRTGGTLTVTGDVVNNKTIRIATSTSLVATGSFVNNGVLDLLTSSGGLPPNLVNNGVVIDSTSLAMSSVSKVGNTLAVTVPTHSGHTYQMQRADSLTAPNWTPVDFAQTGLTQANGLPTARTFTDTAATGTQRFYRVTVTP